MIPPPMQRCMPLLRESAHTQSNSVRACCLGAQVTAIRKACARLGTFDLSNCVLYT